MKAIVSCVYYSLVSDQKRYEFVVRSQSCPPLAVIHGFMKLYLLIRKISLGSMLRHRISLVLAYFM